MSTKRTNSIVSQAQSNNGFASSGFIASNVQALNGSTTAQSAHASAQGSNNGSTHGSPQASQHGSVHGSPQHVLDNGSIAAASRASNRSPKDLQNNFSYSASVAASSYAHPDNYYLSEIEAAILRSQHPIEINETEEITVNGQRGIWANRSEVINWKGVIPLNEYLINQDTNPELVVKKSNQKLEYVQEMAIRYLRPPTPPAPGEIIITQEGDKYGTPAPPLIIRQQPLRPDTPEPLVVREAPPTPPVQVGQKLITISGKRLPPPPRKVIIERLAPLPAKPQSVIIERWLPYAEVKRKVIFKKSNEPDPIVVNPKNVIVQWEAPDVQIRKEFKYLGVIRANPAEYVERFGHTLRTSQDLPQFILDIPTQDGLTLAADHKPKAVHDLEGDVHALKLVDLDKEGLGHYKDLIHKIDSPKSQSPQLPAPFSPSSISAASVYGSASIISKSAPSAPVVSSSAAPVLPSIKSNKSAKSSQSNKSSPSSPTLVTPLPPTHSVSTSTTASLFDNTNNENNWALNEIIEEIFKTVDYDDNGRLNRQDVEKTFLELNNRLGRKYGEYEIQTFFNVLDANQDGSLSLNEFKTAFLNKPF